MAWLPRPCAIAREIKIIPGLTPRPGLEAPSSLGPTQEPPDVLLGTTRPIEHTTLPQGPPVLAMEEILEESGTGVILGSS